VRNGDSALDSGFDDAAPWWEVFNLRAPGLVEQWIKQVVRRTLGEPYVGKRLKLRHLNRVMPTLRLSVTPFSILDAGAEDATFVYWLADRYPEAQVMAIDIDTAAVAACRAVRPKKYAARVRFEVGTFSALEPESFDMITAFDVLEHISDDREAVSDLTRALRPGGSLLVHVPRDQWTRRDGGVERVADEDAWRINPGHVRQGYSPESVRRLLDGAGLSVVDMQIWLGRWGVMAHEIYAKLQRPVPLRLLTIPVTDVCAYLDRAPSEQGNTVFVHALKPSELT
jgi:SAM-dependent methyltransferase